MKLHITAQPGPALICPPKGGSTIRIMMNARVFMCVSVCVRVCYMSVVTTFRCFGTDRVRLPIVLVSMDF